MKEPPKYMLRFFRWFCRPQMVEDIEGDLVEKFQMDVLNYGEARAKRKLTWQIVKLLRPEIVRSSTLFKLTPSFMFRYHFLMAWRNAKKDKSTFLINLVGLTSGLACVIFIYLWVTHELGIDKFHQDHERIYQVVEHLSFSDGIQTIIETVGPMAEALSEEMPEVEFATATISPSWFGKHLLTAGEKNIKAVGQLVDENYFNVFSYELIDGERNQVMADPNAIALSSKLAINLFGTTENILGKFVEFDQQRQFQVTGVFKDIPDNSSVQFDFALSTEASETESPWNALQSWNSSGPGVFVLLKEGSDITQLNAKVAEVHRKRNENTIRTATLVPFSDLYLYGRFEDGKQLAGRMKIVRLISIIALIILVIACINFMNLTTASASKRLKEIGVKKVVGATRRAFVSQFLTESVGMAALAFILSVGLVLILLPRFNMLVGKDLVLSPDLGMIIAALVIVIATGLIAGSYPAFYLSGFHILAVLKGKLPNSFTEFWTRKGLVVAQFTISIILIISVFVIYKQIDFVQSQYLGYDQDNIVSLRIEGNIGDQLQTFKNEAKQIPGIVSITTSTHDMIGHNWSGTMNWEGKDPNNITQFQIFGVGEDFLETMGMEVLQGRGFDQAFGMDSLGMLLNETAIRAMGLEDPVGKSVADRMHIVGVVQDFHFKSLHDQVEPSFIMMMPHAVKYIMIRIQAGKERQALQDLGEVYEEFNPGFPFEYTFLNEGFQAQYESEVRVANLSKYFAILAILISCLGLLGLAMHTAQQRTKEIGIRKVLGASAVNIMVLLSQDFIKLVFIAIVISTPIAWLAMRRWLQDFAYHIKMEWWIFAGAALAAILIAVFTVSGQSIKAALASPIKSIHDE